MSVRTCATARWLIAVSIFCTPFGTSARPCAVTPETLNVPKVASYSTSQVVITPPTEVFPRLDLARLVREPELQPQLDLFIQAYANIQQRPASSPVSYFQLAGIHGQPYEAWDGVVSQALSKNLTEPINGTQPGRVENFAGYCWHASVIFPTWHRAFTLLMEQEVRKEAQAIARQYNKQEQPRYLEAARQLRFPYWDWVGEEAASVGLPEYVLQKEVVVHTPTGIRKIRNPLESFTFPRDVAEGSVSAAASRSPGSGSSSRGGRSGDAPSLAGNPTLRHPDLDLLPQYDRLQNDLISEASQSIRPAWFKLYTDPEIAGSWARFATHQPRSDGRRPATSLTNIEGIHDLVHDITGGIVFAGDTGYPGHMSDVDTAAFDPLFFLHHANVDRLMALYQTKNPGSWVQHTEEPYQRGYMIGMNGYAVNSTTPLWPFRKAPDTFFTSDDVRDFTALGYTYPDFLDQSVGQNASSPVPSPGPAPEAGGCRILQAAGAVDAAIFRPDDFDGFRWYLDFQQVPRTICGGSTMLSVYVQANNGSSIAAANATLFAGSVAIFGHSSCAHHCHEGTIDGQVDLTEQLLELGLIELQDQAYYSNLQPGAQPTEDDSPPADFLQSGLRVIVSCAEAQFEMDGEQKEKLLGLSWGRIIGGYQSVGTIATV